MTEKTEGNNVGQEDTKKEKLYREIATGLKDTATLIATALIIRGGIVIAVTAVSVVAAAISKARSENEKID